MADSDAHDVHNSSTEKTNGNGMPTVHEVIDLGESDSSDFEIIAVSKSIADRKRKKVKKIRQVNTKVYVNSVNCTNENEQDSYIKEEIIISDASDSSDDDLRNVSTIQRQTSFGSFKNRPKRKKNDESLSSIILNCPRCNQTKTVFSATITCSCEECNISMFYVCNQCNLRYETLPALYRHKKMQCDSALKQIKKPLQMFFLKCPTCTKTKKITRYNHSKRCIQCKINMSYECIICGKTYNSYSALYRHAKLLCQASQTTFYCNDCNFKATSQKNLLTHLNKTHERLYQIKAKCSKCQQIFDDTSSLTTHELICGELSYRCKFCSFKPKFLEHLKKHIVTNHREKLGNKTVEDILSEIATENNASDSLHEFAEQVNPDDFSLRQLKQAFCPTCNEFRNYNGQRVCFQCYTGYRFPCALCNCTKMFARPQLLYRHVRRQHGQLVYRCEVCARSFSFLGDANAHRSRCGEEPRFACQICFFKTRYRYNLRKHMQNIHKCDFYCGDCRETYATKQQLDEHREICSKKKKNDDMQLIVMNSLGVVIGRN